MAPANWASASIGGLIDEEKLLAQNGFPCGEHNQKGEGVIQLRPFNVSEAGTLNLSQTKYVPEPPLDSPYWVEKGDIIFNNTNSEELVGKTAYCDEEGAFVLSNHMTLLRVLQQREIDARWLSQHLHFLWQSGEFRKLCRRHVNQASVGAERLRSIEVPLPPLREQVAIAKVLDAIRKAQAARQRELALERERKAALMECIFTYGAWREHVDWEQVILASLIAWGPQNGVYKPSVGYGEGCLIIRINDFDSEGILDTLSLQRLQLTEQEATLYGLVEGDILINRVNSLSHLGKSLLVGHVPEPTVFESNMMRFRVNESRAIPEFVTYFLLSEKAKFYLKGRAKRAVAQSSINQGDVRSIPLCLPSISEQTEIVSVLGACDRKLQSLRDEYTTLGELFRAMLEELMTGRLSAVPLIEENEAR